MTTIQNPHECHADKGYLVLSLLMVFFVYLIFIISIQPKPKREPDIMEPNVGLPSKLS